MTRYVETTTLRDVIEPPIPIGNNFLLPILEVRSFERVVLQWTQRDPGGGAAAGTVTGWRFYRTALPLDQIYDAVAHDFHSPLVRPDLWEVAADLFFPSLPAGALGTATVAYDCAGYTFLAAVIDVAVAPLEVLTYHSSAFGP